MIGGFMYNRLDSPAPRAHTTTAQPEWSLIDKNVDGENIHKLTTNKRYLMDKNVDGE
jgi:hypothetical protein